MQKQHLILLFLSVLISCKNKEDIKFDVSHHIVYPKTYVVYKASDTIHIDGLDNEKDWSQAKFTDDFIDIEGNKNPNQTTKLRMLWDKDYLYIYAKLYENHIWADITKRDAVIFYNNDFEVFISPSNDTHNYGEIEINALNTVWDLLLDKPYNVGGKPKNSWNLNNLKSAVHIQGTLNDFSDEDEFWAVELAIPLIDFIALKNIPKSYPKDQEQWRINFSRVQWQHEIIDNKYHRKKANGKFLKEDNWVWSNQNAINMHLPENWGYLQFSENTANNPVKFKHQTDVLTEQITYALYRAINFGELRFLKEKPTAYQVNFEPINLENVTVRSSFLKTHTGFTLQTQNVNKPKVYLINETALIQRKSLEP